MAVSCLAKKGRGYRLRLERQGQYHPLVTEGNGLPLAFLVTAANVSEVTVGLKVIDQVKVPRPQGRPRQRPAERHSAIHTPEEVEEPSSQAWSTFPGTSSQPESLEGRAESWVVRQLAEIGHQV